MGTDLPKQFLPVSGKPLLMYTLEAFSGFSPEINLILVLPPPHIDLWKELCSSCNFRIGHEIVAGGETRGDSVRNGLNKINVPDALIAVHDGVRPFADKPTINKAFELALEFGNAVPSRAITDSVRIVGENSNSPFDRKVLRSIQTPQCFYLSILRKAYNQTDFQAFTDDAGLVEGLGIAIHLFEGNPENIKITSPFDLVIAEAILNKRKPESAPDLNND